MKRHLAFTFIVLTSACAAAADTARPAEYGARLAECNRTSKTCTESIACENTARAEFGRALRQNDGCR
jgi:hypothetical protein